MAGGSATRRLLFALTRVLALGLTALVLVAPWLDGLAPAGWERVVELFGHDGAVRRTALASAVGLIATAYVFFRPPSDVAGA